MQKLRSSETSPGLHPPSAQKERAVDGARIFVTYSYYYYYISFITVTELHNVITTNVRFLN